MPRYIPNLFNKRGKYSAMKIQRRFRARRKARSMSKLKQMVYANQDNRWKTVVGVNVPVPSGLAPAVDFLGLNDIGKGTEHTQREGNKIQLKSFNLKGQMFNSSSDAYNKIRILIVSIDTLFNTPNLQTVQIQQILEPDLTDPTTPTTSILSHYRKNSQYKYHVLYDRMYQLQAIAAGSTRHNNLMWNIQHKFKTPLPIHYQSGDPDLPVQNPVYLFAISDSKIAPHPLLVMNTRVNWTG